MLGFTLVGWIFTLTMVPVGLLTGYLTPRVLAGKSKLTGHDAIPALLALVISAEAIGSLVLSPINLVCTLLFGVAFILGASWPASRGIIRGR